jgi:hypothetical protein
LTVGRRKNNMSEIIGASSGKSPIGIEARCWGCNKIWNISLLPAGTTGVKCTCGGYVVTPSGKVMTRPIYDEFESTSPLLELGDNEPRIILPGEE